MEAGAVIPNILATRYASVPMVALWSPERKVVLERELWLAILRAQRDLGVEVADGVIEDYEAVVHQVDLASIDATILVGLVASQPKALAPEIIEVGLMV